MTVTRYQVEKLLEADATIVEVYRGILKGEQTVGNGMRIGMLSAALASVRHVLDSLDRFKMAGCPPGTGDEVSAMVNESLTNVPTVKP
jgi:hypothetical protein